MAVPSKRGVKGFDFQANSRKSGKLEKGLLEENITVTISGNVNLTTAGVPRLRGSLLRTLKLSGDKNKVLKNVVAEDLVIEQEIYEQNRIANMIFISGGAVGAQTFRSTHTLSFREPFAEKLGDLTNLPTWIYENLNLELEFGDVVDLFSGGAAGVLSNVVVEVSQNGYLKYPTPASFHGDAVAFGRTLAKSIADYVEYPVPGAQNAFSIEVPKDTDIRSIVIVAMDAQRVLSDALVANVTFKANRQTEIFAQHGWYSLKAENGRIFGVQMPVGVAIVESAEDKDITDIWAVTGYSSALLNLQTNGAGVVRVYYRKLEAGA